MFMRVSVVGVLCFDGIKYAFGELSCDLLCQLLPFAVDARSHRWSVAARHHGNHGIVATVDWTKWHWLTFERFDIDGMPVKMPVWSLDGEMKSVLGVHAVQHLNGNLVTGENVLVV